MNGLSSFEEVMRRDSSILHNEKGWTVTLPGGATGTGLTDEAAAEDALTTERTMRQMRSALNNPTELRKLRM